MTDDAERDEKIGREIVTIVAGRRGDKLRAMLADKLRQVQAATKPAPVTEPPAVEQARKLRITRKPAASGAFKALDELPPEVRWRIDRTPYFGKRQQERARRQAAKKAGYDPASRTHHSGSELIPDVTDADIANSGGPREKTDATPHLITCPRCNQYNPAINYECRVCGFEFGFST